MLAPILALTKSRSILLLGCIPSNLIIANPSSVGIGVEIWLIFFKFAFLNTSGKELSSANQPNEPFLP